MKNIKVILILLLLILFSSCEENEVVTISNDIIVLGHTYQWGQDGNKVDKRLEKFDYSSFAQKWLLGDICGATIRDPLTLEYLDDLFDLTSDNTKWAVGNHDLNYGDPDDIINKTMRPLHYGVLEASKAIYVLNTQIHHETFKEDCDYRQSQHEDFLNFLNTVLESDSINNLFILSHNTVWSNLEEPLLGYDLIGNATSAWMDFRCQFNTSFRTLYSDLLFEIQNKGIQVIFVSGDGGQYRKTFFETGKSGIQYYVSGINNSVVDNANQETISKFNTNPDSILIFRYDAVVDSYKGEFVGLE